MKIKDITYSNIRAGSNWRVVDPNALLQDGFLTEELEIELFDKYILSDLLVYSGVSVYLKKIGEPRTGLLDRLLWRGKRRQDCRFPPDDPNELQLGVTPIVTPLVMIKEVQESGCEYCECVNNTWQQVGLKPNPDAPLDESYFANPVEGDLVYDVYVEDMTIGERNKQSFDNWISYLHE